jgi:hypothetical protein
MDGVTCRSDFSEFLRVSLANYHSTTDPHSFITTSLRCGIILTKQHRIISSVFTLCNSNTWVVSVVETAPLPQRSVPSVWWVPLFRCSVITFKRSAPWYDARPPRTTAVDVPLSSPYKSSFVANCTQAGPVSCSASSPSLVLSPCATTESCKKRVHCVLLRSSCTYELFRQWISWRQHEVLIVLGCDTSWPDRALPVLRRKFLPQYSGQRKREDGGSRIL